MRETNGVLESALKVFGKKHQEIKVCEELGELQAEIFKSIKDKGDRKKILEELADVEIVLNYVKMIYDISEVELSAQKAVKVLRLMGIIEQEEQKNGSDV